MSSGDGAAGAVAGRRSKRGNKDRGRKDNGGRGCFMGGFIGTGQGRRAKSSLHFNQWYKVQAAFKLLACIIIKAKS